MAVNGVEIKVGQKWQTRGGKIAEVTGFDEHPDYPVDLLLNGESESCGYNGRIWGDRGDVPADSDDLIELLEDAPAPSAEIPVEFAGSEPTDADALASETLTALGYRFDGQCWVPDGTASTVEQHPLYPVFVDAINQAMFGKGQRHGGATVPFLDQPIFHYAKMHGRGFLTGQAAKKLEEAASTRAGDAFVTEVLGALVYAGAAIISERGAK